MLEGASQGQTQLDSPHVGGISRWNHPLDLHLATRGLSGWPHLQLQIYHLDDYSRVHLAGYASVDLPTRPGVHSIDVPAWRPLGNAYQKIHNISAKMTSDRESSWVISGENGAIFSYWLNIVIKWLLGYQSFRTELFPQRCVTVLLSRISTELFT